MSGVRKSIMLDGIRTVEVLIRVHARLLRRGPAGRIHRRRDLRRVILLPPFDEQSDRVLRLGDAPQADCRALGRGGRDLHGSVIGDHGIADIDMVGVEIVRDVTVLARPRLERLQLVLGLAHVAVEVVEVAQGARLRAGVSVRGIEALVVLDVDEDTMFPRLLQQVEVVGEELRRRLGDQDVDLALDSVQGDWVVGRVGREYGDGGAWLEGVDGRLVGFGVGLVVCGEGLERDVKTVVDLRDVLLKVLSCSMHRIPRWSGLEFLIIIRKQGDRELTDPWELGA